MNKIIISLILLGSLNNFAAELPKNGKITIHNPVEQKQTESNWKLEAGIALASAIVGFTTDSRLNALCFNIGAKYCLLGKDHIGETTMDLFQEAVKDISESQLPQTKNYCIPTIIAGTTRVATEYTLIENKEQAQYALAGTAGELAAEIALPIIYKKYKANNWHLSPYNLFSENLIIAGNYAGRTLLSYKKNDEEKLAKNAFKLGMELIHNTKMYSLPETPNDRDSDYNPLSDPSATQDFKDYRAGRSLRRKIAVNIEWYFFMKKEQERLENLKLLENLIQENK